jgi:hypothetical protein
VAQAPGTKSVIWRETLGCAIYSLCDSISYILNIVRRFVAR